MILEFTGNFKEDFIYWKKKDKKIIDRILTLMSSIEKNPFAGIGKPKLLKYELSGCWSRRINKEHRIVYRIMDNKIQLIACRYHY